LPVGRRIASPGLRDGRDGSNASMSSSTGVVAREAFGVTRREFALEQPNIQYPRRRKKGVINNRGNTKQHNIRCFPVKIGHFYPGGLVHESAIGFRIDGPR
jgi:hypothetical protein